MEHRRVPQKVDRSTVYSTGLANTECCKVDRSPVEGSAPQVGAFSSSSESEVGNANVPLFWTEIVGTFVSFRTQLAGSQMDGV
jgi:hypothetical protein